jgi:hypothetical protein
MHISNAKQNSRSDDPVWHLIAEFSLQDFLSGYDRRVETAAGSLFQLLQELGMSPEFVENIARTLAGFVKEVLERDKQERQESPGRIQIFCQKKILDDVNPVKTSATDRNIQGKKHTQSFPDSETNMIGGWGYFMIERGENLPSSATPQICVDLYIYKEYYLNADFKY